MFWVFMTCDQMITISLWHCGYTSVLIFNIHFYNHEHIVLQKWQTSRGRTVVMVIYSLYNLKKSNVQIDIRRMQYNMLWLYIPCSGWRVLMFYLNGKSSRKGWYCSVLGNRHGHLNISPDFGSYERLPGIQLLYVCTEVATLTHTRAPTWEWALAQDTTAHASYHSDICVINTYWCW